jgi:hypothetical protein
MNALESLEKEVTDQVNQMTAEVVLLLIERWEERVLREFTEGKISVKELLYAYVDMKISLHRVKRRYENDYYACDLDSEHKVKSMMNGLNEKIKKARKEYYVAKHRYEPDQHGTDCTCRGCNCIKGISSGRLAC